MKLIPVKDEKALKEAGIFYKPQSLYKMHSIGELPEIFTKIGAKLLIVQERWNDLVEKAIAQTDKKAAKLKKLKEG
jgi:hypothetical protein